MYSSVLYSRTLPFIRSVYNGLHLLTPTSHSSAPRFPPLGNQSLLFVSHSLSVSQIHLCLSHALDSTDKGYHMMFAFLCLTYITQYNLQLHPRCCEWHDFILFLWLSSVPLYTCPVSSLGIPLLMDIEVVSVSLANCVLACGFILSSPERSIVLDFNPSLAVTS